jgi:hypothetical protein
MRYPIFDNLSKHIADRHDNEAISLDGMTRYNVDATGNLIDKATGIIMGHLIPSGQFLPDGSPAPSQDLF